MKRAWLCIAAILLACSVQSAPPAELRVGTSGDYAPFSTRDTAGHRDGFDVALARAYASERGLRIRWVPLRWPDLERDLAAGRFDVVMSGVTVRPERSLLGRFSVPVASSGLVLLAAPGVTSPETPGLRLAVNAGGHLERAARRLFPEATLLPTTPNAAVREALRSGRADAAVSDTLEVPSWLAGASGWRTLGPYTHDWKACWLPADATGRARDLDAWLLAREADGTLAALRRRFLPESAREPAATALRALAAAIDERLALMPLVAEAKRAAGIALHAPAQERAVLAAARANVRDAAARSGRPPPADATVDALFTALIEAAREIQARTLEAPSTDTTPADLDTSLRPALARVSERIARLLVELSTPLDAGELAGLQEVAERRGVSPTTRARITQALLAL